MKNKNTITKHYLKVKGISYSIVPLDRPTLSEWLAAYNTNPRLIDEERAEYLGEQQFENERDLQNK